jgi:hypothetical protein
MTLRHLQNSAFYLLFFSILVVSHETAYGDDVEKFKESIKKSEQSNRATLITDAKLDVYYFRLLSREGRYVTFGNMKAFFNEINTLWKQKRNPDDVVELSKKLNIPESVLPNCWLSGKIIISKENIRNSLSTGVLPCVNYEVNDIAYVDGNEVRLCSESQRIVFNESRSTRQLISLQNLFLHVDGIDDLKYVGKEVDQLQFVDRDGMNLFFDNDNFRLVTLSNVERNSGTHMFQTGFEQHKLNKDKIISLPTITARVTFNNNSVQLCQLFVIKSMDFSEVLPGDFRITVPKNMSTALKNYDKYEKDVLNSGLTKEAKAADEISPSLKSTTEAKGDTVENDKNVKIKKDDSIVDNKNDDKDDIQPSRSGGLYFWLSVIGLSLILFFILKVYFFNKKVER